MKSFITRWGASAFLALCAVVFFAGQAAGSHPVVGAVSALVLLLLAWLLSPSLFPRSADLAVAQRRAAAEEAPLVFWKPGCSYCILLRLMAGAAGRRASWVDSSIDDAARSVVRSVNEGNHTTPTVVFGEQTRTNPDAAWVRSLLR